MSDAVYLDWAATSPLCEEALAAMQPYLRAGMAGMPANANANALHSAGRAAYTGCIFFRSIFFLTFVSKKAKH